MKMKNYITIFIYGIIILAVIAFFINLLPIILPVVVVLMLINYFRRKKCQDSYTSYYSSRGYEDEYESRNYQTRGNIKSDVIDVEYKETVEK